MKQAIDSGSTEQNRRKGISQRILKKHKGQNDTSNRGSNKQQAQSDLSVLNH